MQTDTLASMLEGDRNDAVLTAGIAYPDSTCRSMTRHRVLASWGMSDAEYWELFDAQFVMFAAGSYRG